ncbi:SCP2 sterol-binding domain-containing protein [Shewanella sp. Isolate11]|uniref:ubiquinone anaerobic biosynthesis accessory factor UbiT n=1 Tax=Shewanella sp. Isolate11 TaxID=2908530 RepID=UPI001EFDB4B3|nr:SCP2 sterol-binding domain-containing protein [Shewanella sp. Isolate11]MCG9696047.1 SCP2 sterol-binding domain-containing protein [Shewanella sp. Isolate11]
MQKSVLANVAENVLRYGPKAMAKPLAIVPFSVKARVIEKILDQLMAQQIADEELDFLKQRWVKIEIQDMNLSFEVSFENRFKVREQGDAEVTFSAPTKELVLIAAAKEDPDTLFFQRKLAIEGDTELGLEVKNLLLSIEFDAMPKVVRQSIEHLANLLLQLQRQVDAKWV